MEKFTTFSIEKKFGIKRNRLKYWIEKGYITPSIQKSKGRGQKNIFSLSDVSYIFSFERSVDIEGRRPSHVAKIDKAREILATGRHNRPLWFDYYLLPKKS